jgi:hypothetical protein
MYLIVRDTWIRHGKLEIGRGDNFLIFERCTFMGGTIRVDPEVDKKVFVGCLFEGTLFTAQPLSPRIAADCHWEEPNIEDAMPVTGFVSG